jgi:hypothetical protein
MGFLHFQVSALAYPLFQKQQVCLESADFQTVDCQDLAQACLRYQQVFLELVGCQQVAYQALVPAYLRYRQVYHSPVVLGPVCPHYLPAYLSLAEYLLFQVLLTLFLGYLALVQACQLFQELADFQTAGCQASDLVCQRFQASDPVYLHCQQGFPQVDFQPADFPLEVFPLAASQLADFQLAAFLLEVSLNSLTADFQPVDFQLVDFQPVDFQPADFPLEVFPLAVFQLAASPLLAQVFRLFRRQQTFYLELVGSQLAAFQRLVQDCRQVSQACRILRYQRQQTL